MPTVVIWLTARAGICCRSQGMPYPLQYAIAAWIWEPESRLSCLSAPCHGCEVVPCVCMFFLTISGHWCRAGKSCSTDHNTLTHSFLNGWLFGSLVLLCNLLINCAVQSAAVSLTHPYTTACPHFLTDDLSNIQVTVSLVSPLDSISVLWDSFHWC